MFLKLSKTCTIETVSSQTGHHAGTYGPPLTVSCNYKLEHEVSEEGNIIVTSGWAVLPAGTVVTHNSRITVGGFQPPIILIKNITNYRTDEIKGIKLELGKSGG